MSRGSLWFSWLSFSVWEHAPTSKVQIAVDWNKTVLVSRSTPTFQVVVNPMWSGVLDSRRSIRLDTENGCGICALCSVAAISADGSGRVGAAYFDWDVVELQLHRSNGRRFDGRAIRSQHRHEFQHDSSVAVQKPKPVTYPKDPNQVFWDYTQGTELVDPSGKALGDYYARLVSWYTKGGFTDENGKFHASTHHYKFPVWEVFNEVDFEHNTTPEQYAARYDAVVRAIHAVSPDTKFMGLALASPSDAPQFFEYFLNHAHHQPGIPLDYISYHFYASPTPGETINDWQYTFFNQADRFLTTVRFVNQIRDRLSPETKTDTDELGVILPNDNNQVADASGYVASIPKRYWNAAGALYAYLYVNLAKLGVDVIGDRS